MKRLFFMLVLTFSTGTFFANEKTEALPVENEVATPDFSVESEYKQIRKQERQERRRIRRERKALRQAPERKILRGHFMSFMGITFSVLSLPYISLMIGYAYHVMPWWFEIIENMVFSIAGVFGVLGVPFVFIFGAFPILVCSMPLIAGIVFNVFGANLQSKNRKLATDKQKFTHFANNHFKKYRNFAISCGVVGSCFIPMLIDGILLLTKVHKTTFISENEAIVLGTGFTLGSSIITGTVFSFMFGALGAMAWLKGQTNRLSVDIGVTSGNTGELSCDKKRNALEKPSGVKLAMSVKF